MRYYSVREAKWITLGAQAKKPGTKGANGKKHGGVAVLIGDDGVILKGPAHMKGKKPDELGGRQKTLGEKPGEKQEPKKYQNLAFGPDGEIAEPDAPKSPPPGTGYADLRAAAAQPAPEPTPAPAPAKPAKPVKVPKVAKVAKPEPVAAPTPEPKPEKGETVRAKIARIKAEKEKRYNDTLKKRGKKEADKQKADDKRQAKAEKDALNPAQAEARKKKQVERISKINAARPESLISLVRKEGGISGGDYDYATDIKEFGLKSALNKRGLKLDDMAKALQNAGHLVVPEGKKAEDVLLAGLQTRANSALHNHTGRYDSEYDDFINNREDADNAPGADSDRTASVISRGEEAGTDQGDDDSLAQILGFEPSRSDADEPEPSDYGHPDDYEPSDYEPEEGDLGDGGEITGADTSFDFGAPEPPPAPAPSPASPPVDMFGNATTTAKKQPDMMTDMFGARIQAEAPKVTAAPTVADDAAKSLDWLDKNDPKKDGSAEMFGSLFSPGASGGSAKTQPEAPGEGYADLRAAAAKEPEATPAVGKPAHEMTKAAFLAQAPTDKAKQYMDTSSMHRNKVQAALDGGQNVPSEVLADYPGIKKTEPQPQQGPTAREIKAKLQAETDARQAQGEQDEANVRARNNQDYQKSRQAAIDAGQDVEDGDEKQIRRTIRQNEKDKASALGTIARNGPDTDAQDFADSMDRENNRLKAKLPKVAKPAAPPTVKPSTPAPGEGFADLRAAAKEPEATPPAPPAPPEAPTAKGPDRRSYAERISAGESPEKIMAELDQRSDIARSQRDRPEATPAEKATAQAEIQHARNVSDDKARADVAEKMNKKAADAKSLASVEKPKITIEKSIGYSGKTGDPSYLAKISGKHNGKTFNREFQNGDEDKKAKSDAFRKKKGTYNETHEISPGELYEHAQNGTKKLLAIQPALDGGTAGQKVSFEIAELKEASKILKSFDDSETPNPNGFGANADFVKPLLAHQAKMAKKAGSYEGLTLPVVAKDLEGS